MKRTAISIVLLGLIMAAARAGLGFTYPPTTQDQKQEEVAAYKAWYDANAARDYPKAMEAAKQYLEKFPSAQYHDYVKKWISSTGRPNVFNIARQSKNIAEEIRIGNEALAEDPENLDYLFLLAFDLRSVELFGTPPNYSHGAQAADYSQRAIKLIEAGKVPNVVDKTKWNANQNLSMLYQNLAVIESNSKNTDKALEHYKKASSLDPTNSYNLLNCGSLYQQKYAAAAEKFGKLPEADRAAPDSKPEVKAILDEVNSYADAVIDCWARFLALTAKNNPYGAARDQVFKVTTDLYNFRHPGEPEGLQKLIDQYASTIQPPGGTASTSSPKP